MWNQAHNAYLESRILTADPIELIRLMYQTAITEVRNARTHLANREIAQRSNAITKACEILTELTVALDRKSGGEYAERLAELYSYMMGRLTEANFKQTEEPLAEVLGLLTTILEGWEGMQAQSGNATQAAPVSQGSHWAHAQESGYTSNAWSF
jgi:flagellar protein FliS